MTSLKERTLRGGVAKLCAQAANLSLRMGSLMVLARLLDPKDFGLVGMVTAFTGVLNLFRDFGLSAAAVQRATVTEEQASTLFWINLLVGGILSLVMLAMARAIAAFYHEPRLAWVTAVLATGFLFNAAGVQHSAFLQRQMRITTMAKIDFLSLLISVAVGVGMGLRGYGYWALVGMTVTLPFVTTIGLWIAAAWIPGRPRRRAGVRSMLRFGGTITLTGLIMYVAYNLEKVLLGRFWGAQAVGLYGRAYQLINIPTDNLNTAIGEVAFPALSRVKDDPARLKDYFLKGYSLVLALTLPITIVCALFADDLIFVVLGAKWKDSVVIFRLLAPTTLVFALINPLWWILLALGKVERSVKVALVLAPLVISGYVVGLPYGPKGVALAYSTVMTLWVVPHIAWGVHGTVISLWDIVLTTRRPLFSAIAAAALASVLQFFCGNLLSPLPRLLLGGSVLLGAYLGMLLYVMGQKAFYANLLSGLRSRSSGQEKSLMSA